MIDAMRKVILGDAFRRVYERGDTIWPHKNIATSPGPHLETPASASGSEETLKLPEPAPHPDA
jgi:hypothetical protein